MCSVPRPGLCVNCCVATPFSVSNNHHIWPTIATVLIFSWCKLERAMCLSNAWSKTCNVPNGLLDSCVWMSVIDMQCNMHTPKHRHAQCTQPRKHPRTFGYSTVGPLSSVSPLSWLQSRAIQLGRIFTQAALHDPAPLYLRVSPWQHPALDRFSLFSSRAGMIMTP